MLNIWNRPKKRYFGSSELDSIDLGTKNILISGFTGTGKTTLCKTLIIQALSQYRYVYVITTDESYIDAFECPNYTCCFWDVRQALPAIPV